MMIWTEQSFSAGQDIPHIDSYARTTFILITISYNMFQSQDI